MMDRIRRLAVAVKLARRVYRNPAAYGINVSRPAGRLRRLAWWKTAQDPPVMVTIVGVGGGCGGTLGPPEGWGGGAGTAAPLE